MKKINKIGIIGLGLIGSSLLRALSCKSYELYCVSKSSYKQAKSFCALASDDIKIVQNCDLVFVCTSISQTLKTLDELNEFLTKNTIVVDVASIKKDLLNKKYKFDFILSHPMAGSEKTGFKAGDKDLFIGAKWLVEKENKLLSRIIKDVGAKEIKVNMKKHDELTAQISHLPAVLSFLLFNLATDEAKIIASSGFRDTTRLAMTNSDLLFSMFENNKENVLKEFDKMIEKLNCLKNMPDDEKIKLFEITAKKRAKMYDKNGKNKFKI